MEAGVSVGFAVGAAVEGAACSVAGASVAGDAVGVLSEGACVAGEAVGAAVAGDADLSVTYSLICCDTVPLYASPNE